MRAFLRKLPKLLFSQLVIVGLLLVLQVFLIVGLIWRLSTYFIYIYVILTVLSVCVVIHVVNKQGNPSYKLAWVIPILLFPVLGGAFYLLVYAQKHPRMLRRRLKLINEQSAGAMPQNPETATALRDASPYAGNLLSYMQKYTGYPISGNCEVKYIASGEEKWELLLEELEKAEKYIYLEYFIITEGKFWDSVLEILTRKAAAGVDVRLMYDGMGCLNTLPYLYPRKLRSRGIKCKVFNPFRPFLSVLQNNRDHRKIAVIDGKTAFTGGINLADEYVNITHQYGHWKDTAVMIRGEAAHTFAVIFMEMWQVNEEEPCDYDFLLPEKALDIKQDGFVMAYADVPLDSETVGEYVYLDAFTKAKKYIHICTPYMILDGEMMTALENAAKSGVDVKIIVPHKNDHWYSEAVAKSYYAQLTQAGVQVFEYLPGFIHAKNLSWDDEGAVVGTINLDYRSLYLHFECAAWFFRHPVVRDVEEDFQKTLAMCRRITLENCRTKNPFKRVLYAILQVFAPLM